MEGPSKVLGDFRIYFELRSSEVDILGQLPPELVFDTLVGFGFGN